MFLGVYILNIFRHIDSFFSNSYFTKQHKTRQVANSQPEANLVERANWPLQPGHFSACHPLPSLSRSLSPHRKHTGVTNVMATARLPVCQHTHLGPVPDASKSNHSCKKCLTRHPNKNSANFFLSFFFLNNTFIHFTVAVFFKFDIPRGWSKSQLKQLSIQNII